MSNSPKIRRFSFCAVSFAGKDDYTVCEATVRRCDNVLEFFEGFFDFRGERGCLWILLHIGLLIYAVLSLATGTNTWFAKLILFEEVLDVLVYAIYRWSRRKKYNREDSFWLEKDESKSKNEDDSHIR